MISKIINHNSDHIVINDELILFFFVIIYLKDQSSIINNKFTVININIYI